MCELFIRDRPIPRGERVELCDQLLESVLGDRALHGRRADEDALKRREADGRESAVGEALVFTKVQVETTGEAAAEDVVEHFENVIVLGVAWRRELGKAELGLRRARAVDEVGDARRWHDFLDLCFTESLDLPMAERVLGERFRFLETDITDHDEHRVARRVVRQIELLELGALHRFDGFFFSRDWPTVGVALAEKGLADRLSRNRARAHAVLEKTVEPLLATALELLTGKARMEEYVRHQLERLGQVTFQRVERHHAPLTASAGREMTSDAIELGFDLKRRSGRRPFFEHLGGHARETASFKAFGGGAYFHHQRSRNFWNLATFDDVQLEPVRKRGRRDCGHVKGGALLEHRALGTIRLIASLARRRLGEIADHEPRLEQVTLGRFSNILGLDLLISLVIRFDEIGRAEKGLIHCETVGFPAKASDALEPG